MAYVDLNPIRAGIAPTPEASDYTSIAERIALLRDSATGIGADRRPAPDAGASTAAAASGNAATRAAPDTGPSPSPKPGRNASPDRAIRTPEQLQHESILNALAPAPLLPFDATGRTEQAVPFAFEDYLDLVETTGRIMRDDKRGFIDGETPVLLQRLGIDPDMFVTTASRMLRQFGSAIGTPAHITELRDARQTRYLKGMGTARSLFQGCAA